MAIERGLQGKLLPFTYVSDDTRVQVGTSGFHGFIEMGRDGTGGGGICLKPEAMEEIYAELKRQGLVK